MFSFFSLANSKNVFHINFEIRHYLNNFIAKYMPWLWHWMLSQLLLLEGGPLNPMMVIGQSLMSTRLLLLQNYLTIYLNTLFGHWFIFYTHLFCTVLLRVLFPASTLFSVAPSIFNRGKSSGSSNNEKWSLPICYMLTPHKLSIPIL